MINEQVRKELAEKEQKLFEEKQNGYFIAMAILIEIAQDRSKSAEYRIEACKLLLQNGFTDGDSNA